MRIGPVQQQHINFLNTDKSRYILHIDAYFDEDTIVIMDEQGNEFYKLRPAMFKRLKEKGIIDSIRRTMIDRVIFDHYKLTSKYVTK